MKTENKGREYYRDQQKKYKEINKQQGQYLWISKLPDRVINGKIDKNPLNKGKTYIKPEVTYDDIME